MSFISMPGSSLDTSTSTQTISAANRIIAAPRQTAMRESRLGKAK